MKGTVSLIILKGAGCNLLLWLQDSTVGCRGRLLCSAVYPSIREDLLHQFISLPVLLPRDMLYPELIELIVQFLHVITQWTEFWFVRLPVTCDLPHHQL